MQTSSRGASILAAFVFVAILGVTLIGIESLSPANPNSQTAAGAPAVPLPKVNAAVTAAKSTQSAACTRQIQAAMKSSTGQSPKTIQQFQKNATEQNVCVAAILKTGATDKTDPKSYQCVGETTVVSMDKTSGKGTITSAPDTDPDSLEGKCITTFCDAGGRNCSEQTSWDGSDSMQKWALSADTFKSLSFDQKSSVLSNLSALNSTDQQQLSNLLGENQQAATQDAATLTGALAACGKSGTSCQVNDDIAEIAKANGAKCDADNVCDAASLQQAQKNAQLTQDQLKNLAASQVALQPPADAAPCPAKAGCPGNPGGGVPPPSAVNTGTPAGNNQGNTFGSGSGASGLSSLLSGLAKGLGGAAAPTAPPPAPAQPCSTDSTAYQQQQQQYQQQLQQYNYQLQQYNYQLQLSSQYGQTSAQPIAPQQPTACSPSTQNQCSTQPQQPAASTCSAGTWQPVYNGNCIANWQCSGGNAGTATLSCQPQTADVGMSIAISYSCSAGTATGNGFTASGQSGTSTAIVATPPQGTNTATYSLSCGSNGQTAGAQCSVQVVTPSIVLVANPKTVPSGQTSQIGWITSGMQSCVISSADQPDFTTQNAANTSVSGTANTLPITTSAMFLLHCQTTAGGTKDATTTVSVQ